MTSLDFDQALFHSFWLSQDLSALKTHLAYLMLFFCILTFSYLLRVASYGQTFQIVEIKNFISLEEVDCYYSVGTVAYSAH